MTFSFANILREKPPLFVCEAGVCEQPCEWEVDPDSKLCAACVFKQRHDALLQVTWDFEEGTPEYAAADKALDWLEAIGIDAINNEIWCKLRRIAC